MDASTLNLIEMPIWPVARKLDNHSKLNTQNKWRGEELIRPFNEHKNRHFDNELQIVKKVGMASNC